MQEREREERRRRGECKVRRGGEGDIIRGDTPSLITSAAHESLIQIHLV